MKKKILIFCILLILLGICMVVKQSVIEPQEENVVDNIENEQINNEQESNEQESNKQITNKISFEEIIQEEKEKTYQTPTDSLLQTLTEKHLPVILYFGADYCPQCKEMYPIMESIKEKTEGRATLEYVDKVEQSEIAQQYPIRLIPTQILVNADGTPYNGEKVQERGFVKYYDAEGNHTLTTHIGKMTEEDLMGILKEMGMEEIE